MASIQLSIAPAHACSRHTHMPHPQCYSLILGTKYNYYRETDGSKVGAVKHGPDLVKREPDTVRGF